MKFFEILKFNFISDNTLCLLICKFKSTFDNILFDSTAQNFTLLVHFHKNSKSKPLHIGI
jgi:hypothetical protein